MAYPGHEVLILRTEDKTCTTVLYAVLRSTDQYKREDEFSRTFVLSYTLFCTAYIPTSIRLGSLDSVMPEMTHNPVSLPVDSYVSFRPDKAETALA